MAFILLGIKSFNYLMVAVLSIFSIGMVWLTKRVTSSVWAKEKIIPLVLCLLTVSVLLYLVDFIAMIYILYTTS
jgi:hypothetical protein